MPWLDTRPLEQKIAFISRALCTPRGQFSTLCREFRIARKTAYKWLGRYRAAQSLTALEEKSRRPQRSPARLAPAITAQILALRSPDGWGARKIAHLLWEQGVKVSVATVHRTLLRHEEVHRLDQHTPALTRFERPVPNDLFQADFKGPMGRAGARDEPLTVLDDHSRYVLGVFAMRDHLTPCAPLGSGCYVLGVFAMRDHRLERVQDCFVRVFERYGLPRQVLLDHGTPWWNGHNGWGLSRLSVFLIQQDIELVFGRVGHPQTQGKIERFHRTLSRSMTRQGLPLLWEEWQGRYDGFVERYNQVRPHEALGMQRPAERYRQSERVYSASVMPWPYPTGLELRTLDGGGSVRLEGRRFFVCEALAHQVVALESVGDQVLVRFRHMYVRELSLSSRTTRAFVHPVREVSPMS